MKQFLIRCLADVVLVVGVFVLPWWLWIFLAIASVAFINRHYELVVCGILADAAYGGHLDNPHFFLSAICVVLVGLSIVLKPRLKFYTSV